MCVCVCVCRLNQFAFQLVVGSTSRFQCSNAFDREAPHGMPCIPDTPAISRPPSTAQYDYYYTPHAYSTDATSTWLFCSILYSMLQCHIASIRCDSTI